MAGEWMRFKRHASPVAIVAALESERKKRSSADRKIQRLESLLVVRCGEVADGTWPYPVGDVNG